MFNTNDKQVIDINLHVSDEGVLADVSDKPETMLDSEYELKVFNGLVHFTGCFVKEMCHGRMDACDTLIDGLCDAMKDVAHGDTAEGLN